jgi:integrase
MQVTNLEKAFDNYIQWKLDEKGSRLTAQSYNDTFRMYIRDGYDTINDKDVSKFLKDHPGAESTRCKRIAHFRAFAEWLGRKSSLASQQLVNDFTLRQRKLPDRIPITCTQDEVERFLNALKPYPLAYAYGCLLRHTGLRFSEALNLRESSYYEPTPGLRMVKFFGKRNAERLVPLSNEAYNAFKIWTSQTSYMKHGRLRQIWSIARKASGINLIPHVLRHGLASNLRAKGNSYDSIADLLGNTVEVTRSRYSRIDYCSMDKMVKELS